MFSNPVVEFTAFFAVCRHGLSRTDYHIQYDPQLSFRKFVRERRGRTARNATADLSASNLAAKGLLLFNALCSVVKIRLLLLLLLLLSSSSSFFIKNTHCTDKKWTPK